jgi:hypothetical protein
MKLKHIFFNQMRKMVHKKWKRQRADIMARAL